jgi:hypothetical protein
MYDVIELRNGNILGFFFILQVYGMVLIANNVVLCLQ